jgi:hypothetical protein
VEAHPQDSVAIAIERLNREPLLLPDREGHGIGADIELGDALRPGPVGGPRKSPLESGDGEVFSLTQVCRIGVHKRKPQNHGQRGRKWLPSLRINLIGWSLVYGRERKPTRKAGPAPAG